MLKLNFPIKIVVGFVIAAAAVAATPSIQWKMPIRMVRLGIELTNFGALLLMRGRFIFKMVNLPANRWIMALWQTDQNKNWDGQYVHVCSLFLAFNKTRSNCFILLAFQRLFILTNFHWKFNCVRGFLFAMLLYFAYLFSIFSDVLCLGGSFWAKHAYWNNLLSPSICSLFYAQNSLICFTAICLGH